MKAFTSKAIVAAALSLTMATPALLANPVSGDHSDKAKTGSESAINDIERVTEEVVEREFTAKDLIGQEVFDREGEEVGEIVDIALTDNFPADIAQSLAQPDSEDRETATEPSASPQATPYASASGDERPTGIESSSAMEQEPAVFVSIGGALGIANKVVRIPVSSLNASAGEKRLSVDALKADIEQKADEQETASAGE